MTTHNSKDDMRATPPMPTLSNEELLNAWLDDVLDAIWDEACDMMEDGGTADLTRNKAKLAILSKLESIEKEARIDMLETFIKYEENQPGYIDWDFLANQISSLRGD